MNKRRSAEQIERILWEADRDLARGLTTADVCRKLGISCRTYFRWRSGRGPAPLEPELRVRELEAELDRLKRLVAEVMLDKQMLQDVAKKKW
jgi:putative transposase